MIRVSDIPLSLNSNYDELIKACSRALKFSPDKIKTASVFRQGIDARKKNDVHFSVSADVEIKGSEDFVLARLSPSKAKKVSAVSYEYPTPKKLKNRPIIAGAGPAGLFAAYILAYCGAEPIVLERGCDVDKRKQKTEQMKLSGILDENCNIQFGEGGAGTFSDGKLNTGIKDARIRKVLELLVEHGAPDEILISAKPHVGTDKLAPTIKNIRKKIISMGGEFLFETTLTNIKVCDGAICEVEISANNTTQKLPCSSLILATGHSARDTFEMLRNIGVHMEQKPLSIGARIEHLRTEIDKAQYGRFAGHKRLGAADYKLSTHLKNGRGVYTFCMCPGGYVIPAASEKGHLVTNGMSEHARDAVNSNSALLVSVNPEDFGSADVLAGIRLQREVEASAYCLGGGNYHAPVQRVADFLNNRKTISLGSVIPSYKPGYTLSNIHDCLPEYICTSMAEAIKIFGNKIMGFDSPDAILTAPETRSSSPVRICRGENLQSVNIKGLYPCGEGAGYAGGITSAAVDGIKCAEKLLSDGD